MITGPSLIPPTRRSSPTALIVGAVVLVATAAVAIYAVSASDDRFLLAGLADSQDVRHFWSNGVATADGQPETLTVESVDELLRLVRRGDRIVVLIPDGPDDTTRSRVRRARLVRVRAAIKPETGETLWLCCRPPADGEPVPDEVTALFEYALGIRGQRDVLDASGLDPLLPWDRGVEQLELDRYRDAR